MVLWVGRSSWKTDDMKKFLFIVFLLIGISAVAYVLSHKQLEEQDLWDETLSKVPTPDSCDCDECED